MSPKLHTKPLGATLKERLKAKAKLSKPPSHRIAPPSTLRLVKPTEPAKDEPTPPTEQAEPMAGKKKRANGRYKPEFKAEIVARALKAKETGEETIEAIAKDVGIFGSNIHNWIAAAKKENGASSAPEKKRGSGSDLASLSRELAEAMATVDKLKKRMVKLLT